MGRGRRRHERLEVVAQSQKGQDDGRGMEFTPFPAAFFFTPLLSWPPRSNLWISCRRELAVNQR